MATPATGGLQRNTGIHHRQRTAANRRHCEDEPLDSVISDTMRMVIGEVGGRRQNSLQRAPRELAVARFRGDPEVPFLPVSPTE